MNEETKETTESNVVVGVISRLRENEKEYLLLSSKRDFGKFTGFLYPPGGHLEPDEDEDLALKREIKEELGTKINLLRKIAATPGDVENQITHWWECELDNHNFNINEKEVSEVGWLTRKEILESQRVWPATKNFFERYISD